jgi:hypothetical protein
MGKIAIEVGCGKNKAFCKCGGTLGPRCPMIYAALQYEYDKCIIFPDLELEDDWETVKEIPRPDACKEKGREIERMLEKPKYKRCGSLLICKRVHCLMVEACAFYNRCPDFKSVSDD